LRSTSRRNPYSHHPGIRIHHFPERLFTCPGFRSYEGAFQPFLKIQLQEIVAEMHRRVLLALSSAVTVKGQFLSYSVPRSIDKSN